MRNAICQCHTLKGSGGILATKDGEIIENLYIKVTSGIGIKVHNLKNVTIRNCRIEFNQNGKGIDFLNSPDIKILNCDIYLSDAPARGPLNNIVNYSGDCIAGDGSDRPVIQYVKVTNGANGISLNKCDEPNIAYAEGYNMRGPFPRGHFIQLLNCRGGQIRDFYSYNDLDVSYTEDNINFFRCGGQTVANGVIDGNNSPSGSGITWEEQQHPEARGTGGTVSNVDFFNMGNCIVQVANGSKDVTLTNLRIRNTHCTGVGGRAAPGSGGLSFAGFSAPGQPATTNLQIINCIINPTCRTSSHYWPTSAFTKTELATGTFTDRVPFRNNFHWCDDEPIVNSEKPTGTNVADKPAKLAAHIRKHTLNISWAATANTTTSHYEIEAAAEAEKYTVIHTQKSNNNTPEQLYEVSIDISGKKNILLAGSFVMGIFFTCVFRFKKMFTMMCGLLLLLAISCTKKDVSADTNIDVSNMMIRIKQVNTDGNFIYSDAVKVVVEE